MNTYMRFCVSLRASSKRKMTHKMGQIKIIYDFAFYLSQKKLFNGYSSSKLAGNLASRPLRLKSRQTAITPTSGYWSLFVKHVIETRKMFLPSPSQHRLDRRTRYSRENTFAKRKMFFFKRAVLHKLKSF